MFSWHRLGLFIYWLFYWLFYFLRCWCNVLVWCSKSCLSMPLKSLRYVSRFPDGTLMRYCNSSVGRIGFQRLLETSGLGRSSVSAMDVSLACFNKFPAPMKIFPKKDHPKRIHGRINSYHVKHKYNSNYPCWLLLSSCNYSLDSLGGNRKVEES
jgi:hypothetical protein